MQILRVPFVHEDMLTSVTMTGVTILKTNRYKTRIAGSRDFILHPSLGVIRKKDDIMELERVQSIKKRVKKKNQVNSGIKSIPKKQSCYVVNKKEVVHRIKGYLNQMSGLKQLYFWTVTFPLKTTDDTAFLLLNKWLTRLRQEKMLKSYLWVSERQENGTIHFHIAIPHRMDVKKANKFMRASIMHCINAKEIDFTRDQAKNYNGVDISKDRKTRRVTNFAKRKKEKSLSNYLTKYISKNNEAFTHLAWHSSRDYSNIIISIRYTNHEALEMHIMQFVSTEKIFENEWCKFYRWSKSPPQFVLNQLSTINQLAQNQLN